MFRIKKSLIVLICLMDLVFPNIYNNETDTDLKPLEKNEFFECNYDFESRQLVIFKVFDFEKKLYKRIDYLEWGSWELSKDRRKIIYYEKHSNYNESDFPNWYIIDGNTGKINPIGKIHEGHTSSDLKYLIYQDEKKSPIITMVIFNLESRILEKEIEWRLLSEKYFTIEENSLYILRSCLPNYDFHLYVVGAENIIFAEGYLDINKGIVNTIYDDGDDERIFDVSSFSQFELGR